LSHTKFFHSSISAIPIVFRYNSQFDAFQVCYSLSTLSTDEFPELLANIAAGVPSGVFVLDLSVMFIFTFFFEFFGFFDGAVFFELAFVAELLPLVSGRLALGFAAMVIVAFFFIESNSALAVVAIRISRTLIC